LFSLHCAVTTAISEAMRGHVLSWNVPRGDERTFCFLPQGLFFVLEMEQRPSSCVVSDCWCCAVARRRSQLWLPRGPVCICTSAPGNEPPLPLFLECEIFSDGKCKALLCTLHQVEVESHGPRPGRAARWNTVGRVRRLLWTTSLSCWRIWRILHSIVF